MGNSKKELNTFRELVDSLTFSYASVTQLVECHLAKVIVEGSNPFARSIFFGTGPAFAPVIMEV